MPELPEVETTRSGIEPHIKGQTITQVIVRQPKLRWAVPDEIQRLVGCEVREVGRRGKYILIDTEQGFGLVHLGMSGSLRVTAADTPVEKHDHVDFVLSSGKALRLRDPRRFGAVLWSETATAHERLANLGVEPLEADFTADYLFEKARGRTVNIKGFIMNGHIVVGVGNIYANEALFASGIDPRKPAGEISLERYQKLVAEIKAVLARAIEQGGTTLRDFVNESGQSGYFQVALQVYGRTDEPCVACGTLLQQIRQGQRSTWFCPCCQG